MYNPCTDPSHTWTPRRLRCWTAPPCFHIILDPPLAKWALKCRQNTIGFACSKIRLGVDVEDIPTLPSRAKRPHDAPRRVVMPVPPSAYSSWRGFVATENVIRWCFTDTLLWFQQPPGIITTLSGSTVGIRHSRLIKYQMTNHLGLGSGLRLSGGLHDVGLWSAAHPQSVGLSVPVQIVSLRSESIHIA